MTSLCRWCLTVLGLLPLLWRRPQPPTPTTAHNPNPPVYCTCNWCHTINELVRDRPVYCRHCRHRGDVARLNCDCTQCATLYVPPRLPRTRAETDAIFEQMKADLATRRKV